MVGRADALERLRSGMAARRLGRRQIVWIAGEAGVGKTTLIEHFMAEVGEVALCSRAVRRAVRRGRALSSRSRSAHGVVPPGCGARRADSRRGSDLAAPAAVALQHSRARGLRRELAGAGQARMLREMGELLDRYTENRPLLLVTEDLHWSDQRRCSSSITSRAVAASTRLLWLASFRLTEIIAADHPLRAVRHELRLHGLAEEIVLDAFSEKEVAEYLAARLPALGGDESFVRALHGRTDGLPLFVADVVNDSSRSGSKAVRHPVQWRFRRA